MNEETTKLIQHLAEKLGTSAEHLWAVLCRQAPYSAVTDILTCAALAALTWWSFRFVQRKTTETEDDIAAWCEEPALFAWLLWIILAVIALIVCICSAQEIVSGLLNPEYWALKQIIK